MFQAEPITRSKYGTLSWRPFADWSFANDLESAPLTQTEVFAACKSLPFAFVKTEHGWGLAAILGVGQQKNLFVGPDGKWLGAYVPAYLRGYPFSTVMQNDGQELLSAAIGTDRIGTDFPNRLFSEDGSFSKDFDKVVDFLRAVTADKAKTAAVCEQLATQGVITPWPIKFINEAEERVVDGYYKLDEAALSALPGDVLKSLMESGALKLALAQAISTTNMQNLVTLNQLHAVNVKPSNEVDLDQIMQAIPPQLPTSKEGDRVADSFPIDVVDDGDIDLSSLGFTDQKSD